MKRGGSGYDMGSWVLNHLDLIKGFLRKAVEERVAVVQTGSNKTVDKDASSLGGGRGVKAADIT